MVPAIFNGSWLNILIIMAQVTANLPIILLKTVWNVTISILSIPPSWFKFFSKLLGLLTLYVVAPTQWIFERRSQAEKLWLSLPSPTFLSGFTTPSRSKMPTPKMNVTNFTEMCFGRFSIIFRCHSSCSTVSIRRFALWTFGDILTNQGNLHINS